MALSMAANLKRRHETMFPDSDIAEDEILFRALRDSTIPKLIGEDIVLFTSILNDLFPNLDSPTADYDDLKVCNNANDIAMDNLFTVDGCCFCSFVSTRASRS
jgi:dynein heavy chain